MKKVAVTGPRQAEWVEAPQPQPKGNWALVKVHVAPMCTEYKAFLDGRPSGFLGHEAVGEVVEVDRSSRVRVGDRVVVMPSYPCGGCSLCISGDYIHCEDSFNYREFAGTPEGSCTMVQYLLKPDWILPPIPDDLSYESASLACCALGPSFGAMDRMAVDAFDTLMITGLGPVGLGGVVNAKYRGARVIAVESIPWRQNKAKELGADVVLNPMDEDIRQQIKELTGGRGPDKSLDCSGNPQAHRLCIDATRRRGSVTFIGECWNETPLRVSDDLIRKGLTIHGSWHYNLNLFPKIMQVIRNSPVAEKLISHTFPMSRIQEAMELSASHESSKILLKPWE
jgi:threonine dehydrogenase-like Zn-dependent dehydrogenase